MPGNNVEEEQTGVQSKYERIAPKVLAEIPTNAAMGEISSEPVHCIQDKLFRVQSEAQDERVTLPEIPMMAIDLSDIDFSSAMGEISPEPVHCVQEKIQKRASNVMKLAQENEKLKEELKAMTDRLEAAERRRKALTEKELKIMEEPSS